MFRSLIIMISMLIAISGVALLLFARANEKTFPNCQSSASQQFKIDAGLFVTESKFNGTNGIA